MVFARLIPEVFIPVYSTFVHSQLEHCVQAWSQSLRGDDWKLEDLPRAAARLVTGLRDLPYEVILSILDLFSL